MGKAVIMAGFHFPPCTLSSGYLRMLGFAKNLPGLGWDPVVLSATRCAYQRADPGSLRSIPETCRVHRAIALDAKRHMGVFGRYPGFLEQPDRWASWWPAAVLLGLRLIRRYRARAIWSTYPIMTAHCVAYTLHRLTGIPWIADFRDPVATSVEQQNRMTVRSQTRWEQRVLSTATRIVFTTPSALRDYAARYPEAQAAGRLSAIGNGYEETAFTGLPRSASKPDGSPLVLVHSGVLYPEGRNPVPFLTALAHLKAAGNIDAANLKVVLRASGSEATYSRELQRLGLDGIVVLAPSVPNQEALLEQAQADALLLFQGSKYDRQIPAKVYEYLRIGHPILALVGEHGDTAALLRQTGGAQLVAPDDTPAIENALAGFIAALRDGRAPRADPNVVRMYSRSHGTVLLAGLLDSSVSARAAR